MRSKTEAQERGEDLDRKKNWEWTIEENAEWEKKQKRKDEEGKLQVKRQEMDKAKVCTQRIRNVSAFMSL